MAIQPTRFLTRQASKSGLAGYLQYTLRAFGTATVASGTTSILVADTDFASGDLVIASVQTVGSNVCYVTGITFVAGTSFTIAVNTDPGAGGAVICYAVVRPK